MADTPDIKFEERDDGYLYGLRDEVYMLVKWHSPTQLQVEMWRKDKLLPPDTGNLYTSGFRKRLAEAGRDTFGKVNVPHLAEDIDCVASHLSSPVGGGKTLRDSLEEKTGPSVAERLIGYARKLAQFFHTPEREAFAAVQVGGHVENYPVRSRHFRLWLQNEFWRREKQKLEDMLAEAQGALLEGNGAVDLPEVVRENALLDAVRQLEGLAIFEGPEREVFVRIAGHGNAIYVDLGDANWRAVEIDPDGWRVIDEPR